MVRICGNSYRKSSCSTLRTSCATSCNSGRVLHTGPSYIRSPWYSSIFQPSFSYAPSPVIVDAYPQSRTITYSSSAERRLAAVVGIIALATIVAIAVAVSVSRDCHFISTECSLPNLFGEQLCNDVYDCKW